MHYRNNHIHTSLSLSQLGTVSQTHLKHAAQRLLHLRVLQADHATLVAIFIIHMADNQLQYILPNVQSFH